jgi:hypothetical protein
MFKLLRRESLLISQTFKIPINSSEDQERITSHQLSPSNPIKLLYKEQSESQTEPGLIKMSAILFEAKEKGVMSVVAV